MVVLAVYIDILDITNFDFVALQMLLTIFTSTFVDFEDEVQLQRAYDIRVSQENVRLEREMKVEKDSSGKP